MSILRDLMNTALDACARFLQKLNVCPASVPSQEMKKNGKLLFLQKMRRILVKNYPEEQMKKVEKINIEELIGALNFLYNIGYDYIDMSIIDNKDENFDVIRILVRDEYRSNDEREESPESETDEALIIKSKKFDPMNDDDISRLI